MQTISARVSEEFKAGLPSGTYRIVSVGRFTTSYALVKDDV